MTPDKGLSATRGDARQARPVAPPGLAEQVEQLTSDWAPTAGRLLLGLVLAWFGYHELVQPSLWTGYVPVVPAGSLAVLMVLAHGWLLLMLAVAMIAGIAVRALAAVCVAVLLEIVISLTVSSGLSDLILRDVGVLGLAVCLTAATRQRLVLSR
jgi:uncharacterized membrane protein YphA (DoxX/SURF4 family)